MENNAETFRNPFPPRQWRRHFARWARRSPPDLEQLTRDFRTFVADCETLLKNAARSRARVQPSRSPNCPRRWPAARSSWTRCACTAGDRAQARAHAPKNTFVANR